MYFWANQPNNFICQIPMQPYLYPQMHFHPNHQLFPLIQPSNSPYSPNQIEEKSNHPEQIRQENSQNIQQPSQELIISKSRPLKASRNANSIIIKDFAKSLQRDASKILSIKQEINSQYPIKNVLKKLSDTIPTNKKKYLKLKYIRDICFDEKDPELSRIIRILFKNYLETDFKILVLTRKKNKEEYLKGCRVLYKKVFETKIPIEMRSRNQDE